jgi:hypothetical protein
MRGQITFKIEGRDQSITAQELTIKDILSLFQFQNLDEVNSWSSIRGYVQENVLPKATNLTVEDILELTPSEIAKVWEQVRKVNETFFGLIRAPMVKEVLEQVKPKIVAAFGNSFAGLSKLDMSMLDRMDTLISSMPSTKTSESKQNE